MDVDPPSAVKVKASAPKEDTEDEDLGDWNTNRVTSFKKVFSGGCASFEGNGLARWDTSNGRDFTLMFQEAWGAGRRAFVDRFPRPLLGARRGTRLAAPPRRAPRSKERQFSGPSSTRVEGAPTGLSTRVGVQGAPTRDPAQPSTSPSAAGTCARPTA